MKEKIKEVLFADSEKYEIYKYIKANCVDIKILEDLTIVVTVDYEDGTQTVLNYHHDDTMYKYFYTILRGMEKLNF
ncbi:MAG: hypothetical protein IJ193_08130 [Bacilli bacterium]|nr:hypothetical protein [Bacilli bacterium]